MDGIKVDLLINEIKENLQQIPKNLTLNQTKKCFLIS